MTLTYISIDPGKKNGICGYNEKCALMWMVTKNSEEMVEFLESLKDIKTCIIERYLVYPQKARDHIYSDLETSRVIGRVEGWAERNNIELIQQPATIKKTGYKWIDKKPLPKSNPRNHEWDAHVHFVYWAIRSGTMNVEELFNK